jgi:DNA-directed RNA polymerase subunit RPC12/RpoP
MCFYFEDGRGLRLEEIIAAAGRLNLCPKCGSKEGFWLGVKRNHAYVQCKGCGASFELFEVFALSEKSGASQRLKLFRK